jgi:hypothetical protein
MPRWLKTDDRLADWLADRLIDWVID